MIVVLNEQSNAGSASASFLKQTSHKVVQQFEVCWDQRWGTGYLYLYLGVMYLFPLKIFKLLMRSIFTRDSIYAVARICHANSVCLSVRPSVTRVYCIKTAEFIIILVFGHRGSLRKSDGFTPNGGSKYKGVAKTSNFRLVCGYISEMVRDRGIVTTEDEYKVICALSNGAVFDDLE